MTNDKVETGTVKTCINKQSDGSCGSIHVPVCEDRTVRCKDYPNPTGVKVSSL